ncbi:hypothetical protein [Actinomadura alba]|uniref:Uncharacterized protein n=1 Tax=Actinomadura alba TaxID=406431 RepID=A0ABR7LN01_9ACTN|nr:hypothetical protein [Actinomadura alba]MBC6465793.1 hypothetical protein [Actinomadura alba]
MKRLLSLHHLTMLDADPFELVTAARASGFDCCGIKARNITGEVLHVAAGMQLAPVISI